MRDRSRAREKQGRVPLMCRLPTVYLMFGVAGPSSEGRPGAMNSLPPMGLWTARPDVEWTRDVASRM